MPKTRLEDELIEMYLVELKFARRSPRTISIRRSYLRRFSREVGIRKATPERIQEWLATLDLAPATLSLYLTTYKGFYDFMVKKQAKTGIETNPATKDDIARPKQRRGEPHPIRREDLDRVVPLADPKMKAWLLLGAREGFRAIEIAQLRSQDVRKTQGVIHIEHGKGDKSGNVVLRPEVLEALEAVWPALGGSFWPLMTGEKMSRAINAFLRKHDCLTEAGTRATAHSLRHRFGTDILAAANGNLRVAQEALRHESPQTTAIYTRVNWGEMADAMARLGA